MILRVENITVAFSGLIALRSLSFDVDEGSITGLIGPNGAGKSTFFNLISRLIDSIEGDILFKNESILNWMPYDVPRKGIYRCFQTPNIFDRLTVLENLLVGKHLFFKSGIFGCAFRLPRSSNEEKTLRDEALCLLKDLDMKGFESQKADSLPLVFQRRLELARALLGSPALLLLDEPTAGMTIEEKQSTVEFVRQICSNEGITVIIIEHDIKLISELCEHVIVLNFGLKIAEGDAQQVMKNEEVIKAYLGEVD